MSMCSMHALIFYKGRKINSTIFTSKNENAFPWRMFAQQSSPVYSNLLSASRYREIEILQANIFHHILREHEIIFEGIQAGCTEISGIARITRCQARK